MNTNELVPIIESFLREFIIEQTDSHTANELKEDLRAVSQEILGYVSRAHNKEPDADKLLELAQSRADIMEARIKIINGHKKNVKLRGVVILVAKILLKVAL